MASNSTTASSQIRLHYPETPVRVTRVSPAASNVPLHQLTRRFEVAAVIIFGDTRHTANQPYNYGNGSAIKWLVSTP